MAKPKNGKGKSTSLSIEEVNFAISLFLEETQKQTVYNSSSMEGGNNFDSHLQTLLETQLQNIATEYENYFSISSKEWKAKFSKCKNLTANYNFDFRDCEEFNPEHIYLINKPNGSQMWPDILNVFNKIGLPIEVKSSKKDGIVWNSGYPRESSIYIYASAKRQKTTHFLGEDAITQNEKKQLLSMASNALKANSSLIAQNSLLDSPRWSYYVRNMFNSNEAFFSHDGLNKEYATLTKNIKELKEKIKVWKEKKESKHTTEKIETYNLNLLDLENKEKILKEKIDSFHENIKKRENSCINFVFALTWDSQQKTNFKEAFDTMEEEIEKINNNN